MKFNFPSPFNAALSCIVLFLFFSCSNDLVDETEDLNAIEYQAKTSQTVTLTPINDAFLQGSRSYNTSIIRLEESKRTGYLMFDLSKIEGEITSANLEFTISSDPGYGTIEAHLGNGSNWTETNLSSNNKPNPTTFLGSINKTYKLGSTEKISLKAESFSADKTTLILFHKNGNDLAFASSKTSSAPKLTVTYINSASENITEEDKTPEVDDSNRVNFSKYGAIGDGKADDTKALQAALDSEESLVADQGAVFRITGRLDIDKSGDQNIDWNGSTITVTSTLYQAIEIKKPSGRTTMSDLTIDGAKKLAAGIFIKTVSDFDNVDVKYLYSTTQTTWAFRYEVTDIPNSQGDSTFNDCDCYDVESKSNGVIGDTPGPSRCLIFRWKHSGSSPTVTFNGGVWDGAWGDDGDIFQHEQLVSNIYNSRLIFNNTVMKNFSRRIVKGTGGGVTFKNVTFISPSKSNPRLISSVPSSGMVAMGNFINSEDAHGTIFDGCTFDNSLGYDGRLVINRQDGIIVKNSNFINASVAFTTRVGDVEICNNTFNSKSSIYGYNINNATGYTGMISIGKNNNGSSGFIKLPDSKYQMIDCQ
ncbi:CBM96 family carbohydrate-binding protein [Arenibacter latericius]|uniref:CBM96 family carbohydrate-binding protein n=1 Tax=Arenibacter latericius TaxID=86104 RepID=UPI000429578C|nr:hypothetical protein [Arenibacter latericius]